MIETMKKDTQQTRSSKLFSDERIGPLLSQVQSKDAESLLGESGLTGQLKKRLAERMLEAKLNHLSLSRTRKGRRGITVTAAAPRSRCCAKREKAIFWQLRHWGNDRGF